MSSVPTGSRWTTPFGTPNQLFTTGPTGQNPYGVDPAAYQAASGSFVPADQVGAWWETPGLTLNQGAGGGWSLTTQGQGQTGRGPSTQTTPFGPQMPDWAGEGGGGFTDPNAFYAAYQAIDPQMRPWITAQWQSTYSANERNRRAIEAALGSLTDQFGSARGEIETARDAWLADPSRQVIVDTLTARAGGEDPLISEVERTRRLNAAGQVYARGMDMQAQRAAASGTSNSGSNLQSQAAMRAYGDVGGLQIAAGVADTNRAAQDQALAQLGEYGLRSEQLTSGYAGALAQLDVGLGQGRAAIEAGQQFNPTDYMAFEELQFALRSYEDWVRRADEQTANMEEEAAWGNDDWLDLALQFFPMVRPGSGFWG